jgi:beta-lactamase class A
VIVVVLAALAAAPAAHAWAPDVRGTRAYANQRAGDVSFAVRTEGRLYAFRGRRSVPSASVVKAMLMVAYLNHRTVRGRRLRAGDRALLSPMIRWSNNNAASRVRNFVGDGALARLARRVAMPRFRTAPSWGSCSIDAIDQTRLFLKIDRYVVRRHRRTAMRLLNTIVPSQRWGIARARPAGWAIYFKGGWGSGSGAVDHQVALLRRGRRRVALAIMTTGNPSHEYGKETLRGVAARLLRHLRADSVPR